MLSIPIESTMTNGMSKIQTVESLHQLTVETWIIWKTVLHLDPGLSGLEDPTFSGLKLCYKL